MNKAGRITLSGPDYRHLYRRMRTMRQFEELVSLECARGTVHGEMHLAIGQEGVSAVLERHLLEGDAVVSSHRAHLHALAAGVEPVALLAELFERDGLNSGKGGHMHLFDQGRRFMCTGIVGAAAPQSLGYALAQSVRRESGVTVSVMGDGAVNQGAVYESFNLAAVLGLPVLFLVEDNGYGISVHRDSSTAGPLHRRAESMSIPGQMCDGRDVDALERAFQEAFTIVRGERRPAVLVAEVDRFQGHYEGDPDGYRTKDEKERARAATSDPIARLMGRLLADGQATPAQLAADDTAAADLVDGWRRAAFEVPFPDPQAALTGTYVDD